MDSLANRAREEFCVDVEGKVGIAIFGIGRETCDTIVFLGVDRCDGESVAKELSVSHCCGDLNLVQITNLLYLKSFVEDSMWIRGSFLPLLPRGRSVD